MEAGNELLLPRPCNLPLSDPRESLGMVERLDVYVNVQSAQVCDVSQTKDGVFVEDAVLALTLLQVSSITTRSYSHLIRTQRHKSTLF